LVVSPGRLPADARPLGLDLGGVTVEEAGTRVLRAVDEGRVSIPEGAKLASILKDMISIREVAAFREEIQKAKAAALEAARAGRSLVPAGRQMVEVPPENSGA
jgi:hypothetical protein